MGAAVAIMIRRETEIVEQFRRHHATSADSAKSLESMSVDNHIAVRRLRNRAVIREASTGHFYLDEPSWAATRRTRRRMLLVIAFLLIAVAVAAAVTARGGTP